MKTVPKHVTWFAVWLVQNLKAGTIWYNCTNLKNLKEFLYVSIKFLDLSDLSRPVPYPCWKRSRRSIQWGMGGGVSGGTRTQLVRASWNYRSHPEGSTGDQAKGPKLELSMNRCCRNCAWERWMLHCGKTPEQFKCSAMVCRLQSATFGR